MRRRFLVCAVTAALVAIIVVACGEGGDGTGTAPPPPPPCPAVAPAPTERCTALQICNYPSEQKVAECPFAGSNWIVHQRGEAGTFADAEVPEISTDSGTDGGDATDATDAGDGGDSGDAIVNDAPETSDTGTPPDTLLDVTTDILGG